MSWQQALLDKGCENKSQGTKEEKLPKRQAPAPRRDREAQEAGGTMNVEKTGKAGLPANLEQPPLKLALEGRLLWLLSGPHIAVLVTWRRPGQVLATWTWSSETPACPPLFQGCLPPGATRTPSRDERPVWAGVEFPYVLSFP